MPRYKRTAEEAGFPDVAVEPEIPPGDFEVLTKLRNMWEFASLMQYIFLFGSVVKIDEDFDIEDLEAECVKPGQAKLADMGLALLKYVSSHRGLTLDIFDEYTRRQYMAKAPQRNPFGEDEDPLKFSEFDVYTKIKVMHQLSIWTFGNVDRIRGLMPEDDDHLNWRMEPLGWDREDRAYFVLDDNRLYRRTDEVPPPPSPKPKPKAKGKTPKKKPKSRGTRSSKRVKLEDPDDEDTQDEDAETAEANDTLVSNGDAPEADGEEEEDAGFGFTSKTWECIAITLEEYQDFMASIFRSRDPNERQLRARLEQDVMPIIEKRAEAIRQKQLKKWRELENLQKMATAKRSSRLADKADRERAEREEREAETKRLQDLKMAREEQDRQRRIEEGHESRRLTREQRLKEREVKRILHEEELARLEQDEQRAASQGPNTGDGDAKRISERQIKAQREQHQQELKKLAAEEGKWDFDCSVCGMHGENLDDGTHSIACDRCNVWQHSKCHGFSPKQAESEDFVFVCAVCKRKEEDAKKPKLPPLKLSKSRPSGSPESQKAADRPPTAKGAANGLPDHVARQLDGVHVPHVPRPSPGPFGQLTNGPSLSPRGQTQGPPGYSYPPSGHPPPQPPQAAWQGSSYPPPPAQPAVGYSHPSPPRAPNGYGHPAHQQQHQHVHQHAVVNAGGHPAYPPPYAHPPQPMNGYGPRAQAGTQMHYPHQPQYAQPQYYYPPPQQTPAARPPPSGAQSPSPTHPRPQPQVTPHGYPQASPQPMQQSPRTSFPPPPPSHQQPSPSPSKSPSAPQPSSIYSRPSPQHHPPALQQTPQQVRPPLTGNGRVADSLVPQKHDQSPAPPSTQGLGGMRAFPPTTALTPSPQQQHAGSVGNIPTKKMPETSPGAQTSP